MVCRARSDLGVRLRTLITQDDAGGSLYGLDKGHPGQLNDFEASCETWGFLYGLAFALARIEADPFESNTDVGDRAYEAAWPEFLRYSGPFPSADRDILVEELEKEYNAADEAAGMHVPADEVTITPGTRSWSRSRSTTPATPTRR
jgi:hypothetical protein